MVSVNQEGNKDNHNSSKKNRQDYGFLVLLNQSFHHLQLSKRSQEQRGFSSSFPLFLFHFSDCSRSTALCTRVDSKVG